MEKVDLKADENFIENRSESQINGKTESDDDIKDELTNDS